MVFNSGADDPFAVFTRPPANESPEARAAREAREADEKRISDKIDEELKAERAALKKQKKHVSILLLGQSESGEQYLLDLHKDRALILDLIQESLLRSKVRWYTIPDLLAHL
jgi:hypothetical protein